MNKSKIRHNTLLALVAIVAVALIILLIRWAPGSSDVFLSTVGAAIGGLLGTILYNYLGSKAEEVNVYPCCPKASRDQLQLDVGERRELLGDLQHSFGYPSGTVWKWSRNAWKLDGRGNEGNHLIYGPHTTELTPPGVYRVIFRLRATGLPRQIRDVNNENIIILDIFRQGSIGPNGQQDRQYAIKFIRAKDLADSNWHEPWLDVYSDGTGFWEYRVVILDEHSDLYPDHLKRFGDDVQLEFEWIKVVRLKGAVST